MRQFQARMESSLRRAAWPARESRGPRCAFTLVEVLLTLALLVIVAGLAWVGLQRPLARQRLRSAADAVRSEWCQARNDAMKSGHTYAFRYLVRGNRYHLGPQDDPSAVAAPSAAQSSASDDDALDDDPLPPPVDKTLPQGIRFLPCEAGGDLAAMGDGPETAAPGTQGRRTRAMTGPIRSTFIPTVPPRTHACCLPPTGIPQSDCSCEESPDRSRSTTGRR